MRNTARAFTPYELTEDLGQDYNPHLFMPSTMTPEDRDLDYVVTPIDVVDFNYYSRLLD